MTDKFRILILENKPADVELIEQELRDSGIKFISKPVQTKEEYLKALAEFAPDIILSDYDLPQFNGAEALKIAKKHCPEIPFLLVTGAVGEDRAIEILTGGATDYVMKNRLSRLFPAVLRALTEAEEYKVRIKAEAERDLLLQQLETRVQERTAELEAEIERRRQYELIAEHSRDIILFIRRDNGRITEANTAAEKAYGYSREELLALSLQDLRADETRGLTAGLMADADYHGILIETIHQRKDGSTFPVEVSSQGATVGGVRMLVSVIRDITDRKQGEEALRKREELYRSLFDNAPVGIFHSTVAGKIISVNAEFAHILGYDSPDELRNAINRSSVGEIIYDVPDERSVLVKKAQEITGSWVKCERRYRKKDGSIVLTILAFRALPENPNLLEGFIEDITERKRADEAMRRSESLLRTIIDNSPDPIFMKDSSGRFLMANPATLAALGKPAEEVIGKGVAEYRDDPETGRILTENDRRIMESGQIEVFEETINYLPEPHIYLSTKAPVRDQDGKIIGLVGIARDITLRKQMEQALQKSKDELELKVVERTRELLSANEALLAEIESRKRIAGELRQSEETYRQLVEMNPVGVFRTVDDPAALENKRLHCNEALLRILGYKSLQEWLAESTHKVFYSEADLKDYRAHLLRDGKVVNYKVQMKRKDGATIWALLNSTARNCDGKLLVEGTVTDISEQIRIEERLRSAQKNLRAMASEIVLAEERSRQHFAADLHDTVIQTIGAAKMRSQLIQDEIPANALKDFQKMQDFISQSITQARFLMTEMSPPVLNELGFIPAMEWLAEQIQNQHGIKVEFVTNGFTPLQHEIQVLLFQATRELLMNVVKHAKADKALVKICGDNKKVRIEVTDNGKGFDKRQAFRTDVSSGGFGLFSIRERIGHFGGNLLIQSQEGKRTRVVMTAPRHLGGDSHKAKE